MWQEFVALAVLATHGLQSAAPISAAPSAPVWPERYEVWLEWAAAGLGQQLIL
jgi:hypothetical protein